MGWDSIVGIATRYGLDGPGVDFWWGEIFCTSPDRPWDSPSLLYNGYWGIPQGYSSWGVALTTLPCLLLRLKKERSCTSAPTVSVLDLFWGELYLYLYCRSLQSEGVMIVVVIFFCTYGPQGSFLSLFPPKTCSIKHNFEVFTGSVCDRLYLTLIVVGGASLVSGQSWFCMRYLLHMYD